MILLGQGADSCLTRAGSQQRGVRIRTSSGIRGGRVPEMIHVLSVPTERKKDLLAGIGRRDDANPDICELPISGRHGVVHCPPGRDPMREKGS